MKTQITKVLVLGSMFALVGTGVALAAEPAAAPAAAAAAPGSAGGDVDTLAKLHADNQKEIEHGKLAIEKGKSAQVKAFGRKLVADHTAADKKVMAFAKKAKISDDALEAATKAEADKAASDPSMQKLHDATGEDFDQQFTNMMAADHDKSIEAVKSARDATQDAALKQLLTKLLPTLEKHKAMADKLAAKPKA